MPKNIYFIRYRPHIISMIPVELTKKEIMYAKDLYKFLPEDLKNGDTYYLDKRPFEKEYWNGIYSICHNLDEVIEPLKSKITEIINSFVNKNSFVNDDLSDRCNLYAIHHAIDPILWLFKMEYEGNLRCACKWYDNVEMHKAMYTFAEIKLRESITDIIQEKMACKMAEVYF